MRNTSNKKKRAAIICAAIVLAIAGCYLAVILYPVLGTSFDDAAVLVILVLYGLIIISLIVGIILALRQRLKEIEGGEEDEAAQY